jgi:hypothetical protein
MIMILNYEASYEPYLMYDPNISLVDQLRRGTVRRMFVPIKIGNHFSISIQASDVHYCNPQKYFEDAKKYQSFEVAIIQEKNKKGNICQPRKYFSPDVFGWVDYFEEGDTSVASCLSPQVIEMIILDLAKLDKVIVFE